MPMHQPDYVTGAEFARFIQEEAGFRERLERRLADQHAMIRGELSEIKGMVREANGRTGKNAEAIAVLMRDLDAIKSEENEIERTVHSIREDGCSQLHAHVDIVQSAINGWTPKKKAAVAGGLVGGGVLIWPALQKFAEAVHAIVERLP
jgi:hypothetical protein